jgi:sugar O-acyltransferase (sialic acid O-acetyltransferase NeuD family)
MTMTPKKLVIVGDTAFAEIAKEYFEVDTQREVAAFAVEAAYRRRDELHGVPVVDFERLPAMFPPDRHAVFVAIVYTQLNRLRTRLANAARAQGYELASYVSPRAFVWRNVELGEHCFIFEDNTVQPFSRLGRNVVLWSGNHIGHHSTIEDNCFISSHVVISGYCTIGANSFMGVNSTVANNLSVAADNWIGPGVTLTRSTQPGELYPAPSAQPAKVSAPRFFKVAR